MQAQGKTYRDALNITSALLTRSRNVNIACLALLPASTLTLIFAAAKLAYLPDLVRIPVAGLSASVALWAALHIRRLPKVSNSDAATAVDYHLQAKERFITLLDIDESRLVATPPAQRRAIEQQIEQLLARIDLGKFFPLRLREPARCSIAASVALLFVLLFLIMFRHYSGEAHFVLPTPHDRLLASQLRELAEQAMTLPEGVREKLRELAQSLDNYGLESDRTEKSLEQTVQAVTAYDSLRNAETSEATTDASEGTPPGAAQSSLPSDPNTKNPASSSKGNDTPSTNSASSDQKDSPSNSGESSSAGEQNSAPQKNSASSDSAGAGEQQSSSKGGQPSNSNQGQSSQSNSGSSSSAGGSQGGSSSSAPGTSGQQSSGGQQGSGGKEQDLQKGGAQDEKKDQTGLGEGKSPSQQPREGKGDGEQTGNSKRGQEKAEKNQGDASGGSPGGESRQQQAEMNQVTSKLEELKSKLGGSQSSSQSQGQQSAQGQGQGKSSASSGGNDPQQSGNGKSQQGKKGQSSSGNSQSPNGSGGSSSGASSTPGAGSQQQSSQPAKSPSDGQQNVPSLSPADGAGSPSSTNQAQRQTKGDTSGSGKPESEGESSSTGATQDSPKKDGNRGKGQKTQVVPIANDDAPRFGPFGGGSDKGSSGKKLQIDRVAIPNEQNINVTGLGAEEQKRYKNQPGAHATTALGSADFKKPTAEEAKQTQPIPPEYHDLLR